MNENRLNILKKIAGVEEEQEAAQNLAQEATVDPQLAQAIEQQGPQGVNPQTEPAGELPQPGAGEPGNVAPAEDPIDAQVMSMLLAAYNAEVCAAWQYEWARISSLGTARNYLVSECEEHRDEEWDHAEKIAELIDTFGGTLPFTLSQIEAQNPTPSAPEADNNRDTSVLVEQLIDAEEAAVELYTQIEAATRDGGPQAIVVNDLVVGILATEQKHVADLIKVSYAIGG